MEGKTSKTPVESSHPHEFLLSLGGDWEGGCKTWFEPEKLADESPIRCTIQPLLDGRFIQMDYEGSLMDEAMHGRVIFGYYELRQRYEAAWVNNLHMGTGILFSTGKAIPNGFSVLGHYPDPGGGPDWGWRTELTIQDSDHFTLTAFNILPDGREAKATQAMYERKSG
jgi:hypothetical protein